jgi:DNA-binding transcriptional MerR regulator
VKISELSARSSVPLSTIKYYLREGLLPPGERTSPNQASYGQGHLDRLDLIRALREVADLPVDVVRKVVHAVDHPESRVDPIETALMRLPGAEPGPRPAEEQADYERAYEEVLGFALGLEWSTGEDGRGYLAAIAEALLRIRRHLFPDYPIENLEPFAEAAWRISEFEFEYAAAEGSLVPRDGDDLAEPAKRAIIGTILFEPVLLGLRRYANMMRSLRIQRGLPVPPIGRQDG